MKPDKFFARVVEFNNGRYEISCRTDTWDERDFIPGLDETLYLHLLNLEWAIIEDVA